MNQRHLLALSYGIALLLSVAPWQLAMAKEDEIPPVVLSGLKAYQAEGAEAALKAWLVGSPLEGDKTALSQANIFRQAEVIYGKYLGFHTIQVADPTPTTKFVFLQMDFQKGPFFVNFVCYRAESGWIVVMSNFNTEAEKVIPPKLLYAD